MPLDLALGAGGGLDGNPDHVAGAAAWPARAHADLVDREAEVRSRRAKSASGRADHTASTPPGRSAACAAASPARP